MPAVNDGVRRIYKYVVSPPRNKLILPTLQLEGCSIERVPPTEAKQLRVSQVTSSNWYWRKLVTFPAYAGAKSILLGDRGTYV